MIGVGVGPWWGALAGGSRDSLFSVRDADGNLFSVSRSVRDADGNLFSVSNLVFDADGNSFNPV